MDCSILEYSLFADNQVTIAWGVWNPNFGYLQQCCLLQSVLRIKLLPSTKAGLVLGFLKLDLDFYSSTQLGDQCCLLKIDLCSVPRILSRSTVCCLETLWEFISCIALRHRVVDRSVLLMQWSMRLWDSRGQEVGWQEYCCEILRWYIRPKSYP